MKIKEINKQETVSFELACQRCAGSGKVARFVKCPDCEGAGYLPTPLGENLLVFLRRHLKHPLSEH